MANEIQRFYFRSASNPLAQSALISGSFQFSGFSAQASGFIDYNDNAAAVTAALEAFGGPSIGSGEVSVTDPSGNGFQMEFVNGLANTPINALVPGSNTLRKNADTISVSIVDYGADTTTETHDIDVNGASSGTFDLSWDGGSTTYSVDLSGSPSTDIQNAYDSHYGGGAFIVNYFGGDVYFASGNSAGSGYGNSPPSVFNNTTNGSGPFVTLSVTGADGASWQVQIWLPDEPDDGLLNLTVDGSFTTSDFAWNASSGTVASAISAVIAPTTADSGSGTTADPWVITGPVALLSSFTAAEGSTALTGPCAVEVVTVQEGSYVLTADNVACDEPTLSEPTLGVSSGGDTLTAASIATGSPSVGSPVIGQTHALTASNVATASPSVGSPTIKTVLVANSIATGSPTVSSPAIGQTHVLSAGNLASGPPSVGTPTLSHIHVLSTNNLACGNPSVGSPTIVPVVPLTANSVTTQSPSVGQPTISQKHALTASNITTGSPTVSTLSLSQIHVLTSSGVVCDSPSVGSPTIGQAHALSANSVSTGSPSLTSPAIGQIHDLTGSSVATGSPALDSPAISSVLVADSIATGTPDVSSPTLLQKIVLAATSIETSAPSVTSPSIAQVHTLSATSLTTGSPTLTSPTLRRLAIAKTYILHGPGQVTLKGSEPVTLNGAPATHRLS